MRNGYSDLENLCKFIIVNNICKLLAIMTIHKGYSLAFNLYLQFKQYINKNRYAVG
jgi:hypothetical protein